MSIYTLSVGKMLHDSSVAIFRDDELIYFCPNERITRNKHESNFSESIFHNIIENYGVNFNILAHYQPKFYEMYSQLFKFDQHVNCREFLFNKLNVPSHHDYHAFSAFYMSPFEEAVCLIIDGSGSHSDSFFYFPNDLQFYIENNLIESKEIFDLLPKSNLNETCSIIEINQSFDIKTLYKRCNLYHAHKIKRLTGNYPTVLLRPGNASWRETKYSRAFHEKNNKNQIPQDAVPYELEVSGHDDIGTMYETVGHFCGFNDLDGGAGKVMGLSAYGNCNNNLPSMFIDGTLYSNKNLFLYNKMINTDCYKQLREENKTFQTKADMAYNVQKALEKIFLSKVEIISKKSKSKNLILSGGCALNILGASLIKETYPEYNVFVDPIASDSTLSIGMGIYAYKTHGPNKNFTKKYKFDSIYKGPIYNKETITNQIYSNIEKYNAAS